jgi:hypothetical protein
LFISIFSSLHRVLIPSRSYPPPRHRGRSRRRSSQAAQRAQPDTDDVDELGATAGIGVSWLHDVETGCFRVACASHPYAPALLTRNPPFAAFPSPCRCPCRIRRQRGDATRAWRRRRRQPSRRTRRRRRAGRWTWGTCSSTWCFPSPLLPPFPSAPARIPPAPLEDSRRAAGRAGGWMREGRGRGPSEAREGRREEGLGAGWGAW